MTQLSPQEIKAYRWIYALPVAGVLMAATVVYTSSFISIQPQGMFRDFFETLFMTGYGLPVYIPLAAVIVWRMPKYSKGQNILIGSLFPFVFSLIFSLIVSFLLYFDLKSGLGYFTISFFISLGIGYCYVALGLLIVFLYGWIKKRHSKAL